jgi:hypothetical protein
MRWEEHVAGTGEMTDAHIQNIYIYKSEILEERDNLGDLSVDDRI